MDVTREHSLGIGKMHFWKESIENLYKDKLTKEPIAISLHQTIKNSMINKNLLTAIIDCKIRDLENNEVSTYMEMEDRAEKLRTTMILIHMKILRMDFENHPELIQVAEYAGRCLGVLDIIKNIPHDLSKYRLRLPADICTKHSVNIRNLWERVNGRPRDELYDVVLE